MAPTQSPKSLKKLKAEVFEAAVNGRPEVFPTLLQGLRRQAVLKVLRKHSRCEAGRQTPLTAAAWWGQDSVVRLLVDDFGLEPDSDVTLNADGSPGLSALLCATERGHLAIAQFLLDKGARINQVDHSHRTPLHRACQANMVEVAAFLLQRGARTDMADAEGSTCLMTACRWGNAQVVELLLNSGADPNQKGPSGRTALHVAAETNSAGAAGAAQVLFRHQAEMTQDDQGHTPVVTACLHNSMGFVDVALASLPLTPVQRIDILELAGACFADLDLDQAHLLLRRALTERFGASSNIIWKPQRAPVAILGHIKESQTVQELDSQRRNNTAFQMECLLTAERVLGSNDPHTSSLFWKVGTQLCTNGHFQESVAVFFYVLDTFFSVITSSDLDFCFVAIFIRMLQNNIRPRFSDVVRVLGVRIEDIEHQATQEQGSCQQQFIAYINSCLDYSSVALKAAASAQEIQELQRLVERLLQVHSSVQPQCSILHVTVQKVANSLSVLGSSTPAVDWAALTAFLVQCGADVDAADCEGNTPLHNIARLPGGADDGETVSAMARALLDAGAHVDVRNLRGCTPLDCVTHQKVKVIISGHYPLSLKCLAASAAVRHQLAYSALLPGLVTNFVCLHEYGQSKRQDS